MADTESPRDGSGRAEDQSVPPSNKGLLAAAAVLLVIPFVALLWVGSYARESPKLGPFPFFFWYQFAWVLITAALTYAAHRLVLAARHPRPGTTGHPPEEGSRQARPTKDARPAKRDGETR